MEIHVGFTVVSALIFAIGVPLNAAIIRIYTKTNSKVNKSGQREFPLIFAVIDLIALFSVIFGVLYRHMKQGTTEFRVFQALFNFIFGFTLNQYLFGLITASVDKLYAVYFPFKYRFTHSKIIKLGVGVVFGLGSAVPILFLSLILLFPAYNYILMLAYSVIFLLVFVTVTIMYVLIVVKLVQNGQKLGRVAQKPATE